MDARIPSPGGPTICGQVVCGQAICGEVRVPDSYIDYVLELGGVAGVRVNPVLQPFVCLDLDLGAVTCTPLDLEPLECEAA